MNTHFNDTKDSMCTPETPCVSCGKNTMYPITCELEEKQDFFATNWSNKGLSKVTPKEWVEDNFTTNPLE